MDQVPLIEEIYRTRQVKDAGGQAYDLHSEVDRHEGEALHRLVASDPAVTRTLEVGCAYGLSSLHICAALAGRPGARHVIVDPFQNSDWHGVGIANLARAGFGFAELVEKRSEVALPAMLADAEGTFDLVFLDGFHTFDQTMVDFYYANRLVKVGGYVALDDGNMASVSRVAAYVSRYPAYRAVPGLSEGIQRSSRLRRLARVVSAVFPRRLAGVLLPKVLYDRYYGRAVFPSLVVFRKVAADDRPWDWFAWF